MFSPSFSPFNPDELFAACDMSELFHTTNLGSVWETVSFLEIQGNRSCRVQFTQNPSLLYAIDHTTVAGYDLRRLSRSLDGGVTWDPLPADPTGGDVYNLFVDPANGQRILLSDWCRLYYSNDGGSSFEEKYSFSCGSDGLHLGGAFFDGINIYAGTNAGLLVSTNGGVSFTLSTVTGIPSGKKIVSFTGARQGGTVRLFALVTDSVYAGMPAEDLFWPHQDVYVLDWGGSSWTLKTSGLPTGEGNGLAFIGSANNNINTAYVSGQNSNEEPIVYKTINGGDSWQSVLLVNNNANVSTGWAGYQGDRQWSYGGGTVGFTVLHNDASRAAFTDYGFLHLTTDGGSTWRQAYLNPSDQNNPGAPTPKGKSYRGVGFENTSCWWLAWVDPSNIFACFTDIRGVRTTDGGQSWSFDYTGHTENTAYHCLKHPVSGTLYLATSTVHDLYQSTYLTDARIDSGDGRVLFSTDGGETWQVLHDFGHPVIALSLDPNNPNRLYASVVHSTQGGIFVSGNIQNGGASTWNKLANPPRTEGHPFNIQVLQDGILAATYSGRRNASGAFTASSGVFISVNGGQSWEDRSDTGMLYWTKDLTVDPHDSSQQTFYVGVYSGWGGPPNGLGGLYKSTNRGQSWTRILDLDRIGSCAIHPVNPAEMYVATETEGLWYTANLNAPNPDFEQLPSYPFRHPERIFFNPYDVHEIWVTSFGGGVRVGREPSTASMSMWTAY